MTEREKLREKVRAVMTALLRDADMSDEDIQRELDDGKHGLLRDIDNLLRAPASEGEAVAWMSKDGSIVVPAKEKDRWLNQYAKDGVPIPLFTHPAPASEAVAWNAALEWVAGMLDTEKDWAGAGAFAMTVRAGRKRLRWDVDVDYMAGGLCTATVSVEAHNADEAAEKAVAVVLETRESTSVRNAVARAVTHPAPAPATVTEAMVESLRAAAKLLEEAECGEMAVRLRAALGGAR